MHPDEEFEHIMVATTDYYWRVNSWILVELTFRFSFHPHNFLQNTGSVITLIYFSILIPGLIITAATDKVNG
jgi:sensor domain CHASE-containing protein